MSSEANRLIPTAPPAARRPLDWVAYTLMLLLCLIWGFQQIAIKATAADMPAALQLAVRFTGSAAIFLALVVSREGWQAFKDGTVLAGGIVGLLFSCEFLLLAESLKYTSAAHAVVFLYTAPIFSALGLQFLPEERLSRVQWVGIAVSMGGIAVAFLGFAAGRASGMLLGDSLALLGGIMWGGSTIVLRRSRLAGAMATKTVFYQVFVGAVVLGIYVAVTGQTHVVASSRMFVNLLFQTLGVAVLSYLGWFWLLRHYLTSRLMLLALMTPLFGVAFGAMLLNESIDVRFAVGTLCVIVGIAIVNGAEFWRTRR